MILTRGGHETVRLDSATAGDGTADFRCREHLDGLRMRMMEVRFKGKSNGCWVRVCGRRKTALMSFDADGWSRERRSLREFRLCTGLGHQVWQLVRLSDRMGTLPDARCQMPDPILKENIFRWSFLYVCM